MQVFLEAIKFNHDSASATADAFNIRKNESYPVPFPEWQRGTSFTAEESVAAYAIEPTRRKSISIQAKFKSSDPGPSTIDVQAIDASSPFAIGNVLGTVEKAEVAFESNGESAFVPFTLKDVRLGSVGVGVSNNIWRWQFRSSSTPTWTDFAMTAHRIYSVLDVPQGPWDQVNDEENTQLPWTEVLDVACEWAKGAQDLNQAATLITRNVYDLGLGLVGYHGSPPSYALANFDCTNFLKLLRGEVGMGKCLNCSDCATIVSTLANILGCRTYQVNFSQSFDTNPIILISHSDPRPDHFDGHEVAWTGYRPGAVFDACLQVDGDSDPTDSKEFEPLLPTNLPFAVRNELSYRPRVDSTNRIEPELPGHRRKIGNGVLAIFVELDPRSLKLLEQRYNYDAWKDLCPSNTSQRPVLSVTQSRLHHVGKRVNENRQTFVDGAKIESILYTLEDPEVVLREDAFECRDWRAARSLLLRLLGEYRSTKVERLEDPVFAEVAFLATDQASILFAYSQWVVLISSDCGKKLTLLEAGLGLGDPLTE